MLGPFGLLLGGVLSSWSVWPYPFIIMIGHDLMVCLLLYRRAPAAAGYSALRMRTLRWYRAMAAGCCQRGALPAPGYHAGSGRTTTPAPIQLGLALARADRAHPHMHPLRS